MNKSTVFSRIPQELSSTFEKMISQLTIITNTLTVFEKRIETIEKQVGEIHQHQLNLLNQKIKDNNKKEIIINANEDNFKNSGRAQGNLDLRANEYSYEESQRNKNRDRNDSFQ